MCYLQLGHDDQVHRAGPVPLVCFKSSCGLLCLTRPPGGPHSPSYSVFLCVNLSSCCDKVLSRSGLRESFTLAHSLRRCSLAWLQECETASHRASAVRAQRGEPWRSAHCLIFIQSKIPAHGLGRTVHIQGGSTLKHSGDTCHRFSQRCFQIPSN